MQLVMDWCDALHGVSDAELLQALREVKRHSRFFPVPADVYITVESLRKHVNYKPASVAIPEQTRTFDEQAALNRECATQILDMMRSKSFRPVRPDFRRVAEGFAEGMAQ